MICGSSTEKNTVFFVPVRPREALDSLPELKKKGEEVALFLSDQRMPDMTGVEFLAQARKVFPNAKRALLTAYSDIDAAVRAINEVQLDYYIAKPWDPPEEKLYPVLDDLLERLAVELPARFRRVEADWLPVFAPVA